MYNMAEVRMYSKGDIDVLCEALENGMDRECACALIKTSEQELDTACLKDKELDRVIKYHEAVYMRKLLKVVNQKANTDPDFALKVLSSKYEEFQRKTPKAKKDKGNLVSRLIELSEKRNGI
jgi:hypothetical protein